MYREYLLTDTKTGQIFTGNYSLRVLELNQLEKATAEEKSSDLYQWALLFKAKTWEEIQMLAKNKTVFNETADYLRQLSADEKIRLQCEARERNLRDRRSEVRAGREAGLQQGLQQKSKEAAINMATKNIPLEDIAEILEVSLDEVLAWTSEN